MHPLDKIKENLLKASLETKKIPKVDDKKLHESRDKKMITDKHMNGTNVEQYNYEGEKKINGELERVAKRAPEGVDPKKHERCVKDVKGKGHDVGSAHAICTSSMKKEEPDMASPEEPKGTKNKRKPVTHDECGRPFAKSDLINALAKAGYRESALLLKNWGELDKAAEEFVKSNYGPKGMKLYNPTDNIKRKASNTGESYSDIGQNKNAKKYTTSGSTMQQAHEATQQKIQNKKAKASLRTLADMSDEEKAALAAKYNAPIKKDEDDIPPVTPENSKNRKTYLKEFKKSEELEILIYDDNTIDIEYDEDLDQEVLSKAVEELEKKGWTPKAKHKSKSGGLTQEGVESYRRANPGSKLKTAVTEKKPTGKRAKRRKSFCARNKGQIDMHNIDCRKDPKKRACLARKKWRCKN